MPHVRSHCSGSDRVGMGPALKLDRVGGRGSDARLQVGGGKVW